VRSSRSIGRFSSVSSDSDLGGPQKFHATPVPRIGGLAIMLGITASVAVMTLRDMASASLAWLLLAGSLPTFLAGLAEDVTKRVSPRRRLVFTALAAALVVWLIGAPIARTDLPLLDTIVAYPLGALLVTVFVVTGVANSFNIIDGFNGLASMCATLILLSLAYVAFQVDDRLIAALALAGAGAVLGFFIWNFPAGLIFLGDGGAYLLGFYAAELAILLAHRNAGVSPLFALLVCIYPVFETVFSIYRRWFLKETPPGMPDGIHLHSLIYRRLMRWAAGDRSARALTRRNSMTSPYLWMLCMASLVPALLWWDNTPALGACIVLFGFVYSSLYWRIVRFRSPRWLVIRR
jgi:UDP-N-acetylmuramyl pentapeptide phosphotransferase/UDP-N-acetylglucosamine-1-phosphate transferase